MSAYELGLLFGVALFIGGCGGWLLGHWRAYQECCECCTCQDCGEVDDDGLWQAPVYQRAFSEDRAYEDPGRRQVHAAEDRAARLSLPGMQGLASDEPPLTVISPRRHAVVLEPGQTYPGLVELAQQAPDGSQIDGERTELIPWTREPSTWLWTIRLDWETRYPIHQEAL